MDTDNYFGKKGPQHGSNADVSALSKDTEWLQGAEVLREDWV